MGTVLDRFLYVIPLPRHRVRRVGGGVPEDVRVPANHLLRNGGDHVGDVELPVFGGDLRVEQDLQEKVPEFLAQRIRVPASDRIDHFMRLFHEILAKRFVGLGTVPLAAPVRAKAGHDLHQFTEFVHESFFSKLMLA